jgi:hypothetical protein
MGLTTRAIVVAATVAAALALGAGAQASVLVTRDATNVSLKVDSQGRAVVFYTRRGRSFRPLFWGAVNARPPSPGVRQVEFRRDYSGGWGSFRKPLWKTIRNECLPYEGPPLPYLVVACTAPDGSYWALQAWQRMLPNLGIDPWRSHQAAYELHLSHWTGELPRLEVYVDWVYRRHHHLFGRYSYQGQAIHGFGSSRKGNPTDTFGRNVYLDTYNSAYGPGWRRENSFLAHRPNGNFCYGFYAHNPYPGYPDVGRRPPGNGERYRLTALGPGVTPIVAVEFLGLPRFNRRDPAHVEHEARMNALGDHLAAGDQSPTPCKAH